MPAVFRVTIECNPSVHACRGSFSVPPACWGDVTVVTGGHPRESTSFVYRRESPRGSPSVARKRTTAPQQAGEPFGKHAVKTKCAGRRFPKGDRKALWSRPQARKPPAGGTSTPLPPLHSGEGESPSVTRKSESPCPVSPERGDVTAVTERFLLVISAACGVPRHN